MTRPEPKPGDACEWYPAGTLIGQQVRLNAALRDVWWSILISIAPPFEWLLSKVSG